MLNLVFCTLPNSWTAVIIILFLLFLLVFFFYSPFFFEHHNWDIGQQARFLERQNTFDQKKKKKKKIPLKPPI